MPYPPAIEERFRGIDRRLDAVEGDATEALEGNRAVSDRLIRLEERGDSRSRLLWLIVGLVLTSIVGQVLSAWFQIPKPPAISSKP